MRPGVQLSVLKGPNPKNLKKIGGLILALAIVVGLIVLAVERIACAFALVHGALDTVLGVVLILGLVALVASSMPNNY